MSAAPRSLRIPGAHGLSLHALEWSREGDPLLLLHGFGHDGHVWDGVAPALRARHRVLALDQRGHGESDRDPERRYSHEAFARDLRALTEALGPARVVLVGHSMGGYGALHFAAKYADRVRAIALIDAGCELTRGAASTMRFDRLADEPSFASHAEYESLLERLYPRVASERRAQLARHWLRRREDGRLVLKLDPAFLRPRHGYDPKKDRGDWAARESALLWDVVAGLRCPTLVVRGAESPVLLPEIARRMAHAVLADGRLVEIPDAGHPVMLDNPAALGAALTEFLGSL